MRGFFLEIMITEISRKIEIKQRARQAKLEAKQKAKTLEPHNGMQKILLEEALTFHSNLLAQSGTNDRDIDQFCVRNVTQFLTSTISERVLQLDHLRSVYREIRMDPKLDAINSSGLGTVLVENQPSTVHR